MAFGLNRRPAQGRLGRRARALVRRDLAAKRYVYFWVDGIHVQARLEDAAQCLLVIVGATAEGKKEFVALADGVRESTQSWKEMLLDLRRRGLTIGPELAVADGALGFWKALEEVWPKTRGQRCWVHKTANVLNKLPKSQQAKAKRTLEDIWMAETKKDALVAFDAFVEIYAIKYEKAVECLTKDRDALLATLRLPGRALEASAHIEPHREYIRDRAPPDGTLEGMPIEQNRSRHGLQAFSSGRETLAASRWTKPIAKGRSRSKVH